MARRNKEERYNSQGLISLITFFNLLLHIRNPHVVVLFKIILSMKRQSEITLSLRSKFKCLLQDQVRHVNKSPIRSKAVELTLL